MSIKDSQKLMSIKDSQTSQIKVSVTTCLELKLHPLFF